MIFFACRLIEQTDKKLFFVISEVEGAIKSLEILRVSGSRCYYDNLDNILSYEAREEVVIKQGNLMSGTKSILILHRNLGFILAYLQRMKECALSGRAFSNSQRISVYKVIFQCCLEFFAVIRFLKILK